MTVYKGFSHNSSSSVQLNNKFSSQPSPAETETRQPVGEGVVQIKKVKPFSSSDTGTESKDTGVSTQSDSMVRQFPTKKKTLSDAEFEDYIATRIAERMKETEATIQQQLSQTQADTQAMIEDANKQASLIIEQATSDAEKEKQQTFSGVDDELNTYKTEELDKIQQELDGLRANMQQQVDDEKATILEQAYTESYNKAKADVEAELKTQSQELLAAINSLETFKQSLIGKEKDDILKLAVKATEVMTQRQLEISEDSFDDIIKEALNKVTDKDKVVIKVAKKDVSRVRKNIDKYLDFMPDIKSLEVHQDPHQEPGGCIIETKLGYVDASIDLKLSSLEKALLDTLQTDNPQAYAELEAAKSTEGSKQTDSLDAADT